MNRTARLTRRIGLFLAVAAGLLLVPAAPLAAQSPATGPDVAIIAPAAPAPCQLDLAGLQQGGSCSAPARGETQPQSWVEKASRKRGFCHCGCSSTPDCRTSADCGGSSCDAFISCC